MLQRPGAVIAGKYRIESALARGGVGTVWVARHVQLGHPVAVKFLDPNVATSPQVRARFEREARAAAHLRTPHIVQVFDYGIQADTPYLVMELLKGETLGARLRRVKRMSLQEAYRILVQIGKGLRRVHEVGFVHRDLKPANLYLARAEEDEDEIVKILDFGIAKETGGEPIGESTKTGELIGSPHYMSPEQIRGEREVDTRTDLWALGVILYKMITSYLPFPGEVLTAVITKIVIDPIPSAREYLPDAPPSLDAFFARALCRDRTQRFQNVRELVLAFGEVAALDAGVAGPHVLAPPSGPHSLRPGSSPDLLVPSIFPGSMPGMSSSFPGGSIPGSFSGGSFPGGSIPGSFPGGSNPGSFPGGSMPGSIPPGSNPGSFPGGSMPGAAADSVPRPPMSSFPTLHSPQAAPEPTSSPASLTTINATFTAPPEQPPRRSRWIFAAIGAVLLLGAGATIVTLRPGKIATVDEAPLLVAPHAASPGANPTALASTTTTASAEPVPTAAASAEPALDPSASATATVAQPSQAAAATVRPRPGPGSGKPRPAGPKKPVDTIE